MSTTVRRTRVPYISRVTRPTYAGSTGDTTSGSSMAITKPAGTSTGDLLIGFGSSAGGSASTDGTQMTTPTGLTRLSGADIGPTAIFYRICDGTEGSSYTFAIGTHSGVFIVSLVRIIGASLTTPIVSFTKADTSSGVSGGVNAASQTVTGNSQTLLGLLNLHTGLFPVITGPTGAVQQYHTSTVTVVREIAGFTTPEDSSIASTTGTQPYSFTNSIQSRLACILLQK